MNLKWPLTALFWLAVFFLVVSFFVPGKKSGGRGGEPAACYYGRC